MEAEDNPSNEHFLMATRLTFLSSACRLSQCATFQSVKTACVLYIIHPPSLPPSLPLSPLPPSSLLNMETQQPLTRWRERREERGKQPQEGGGQ